MSRKKKIHWAKGLTKETDSRIKKQSETAKNNFKSGKKVIWCKGKNKDNCEGVKKRTETTKKKYDEGYVSPTKGRKQSEEEIKKRSESLKLSYKNGRVSATKGKEPWNKGLTKDTDDRIKKQSETAKRQYKEGTRKTNKGKKQSDKTRKKIGDANRGKESKLKGRKLKPRDKKTKIKISNTLKDKYASGELISPLVQLHKDQKEGKVKHQCTGREVSKEERDKTSKTLKEGYKSGRVINAKGMLGKKASEETIRKRIVALTGRECSKETRKKIRDTLMKLHLEGKIKINYNSYKYNKRGMQEDLGHYVRSSWEAAICRYLKFMYVDYEYEQLTFKLLKDNNEWTSYTPDIYIEEYNMFIEVKGYKGKNNERLEKYNLFLEQYPEYTTLLIDKDKYNEIINSGIYYTNFTNFLEKHFNNKLEEVYY